MKTLQVSTALSFCIKNKFPVLLVGEPGCGKTDLTTDAAKLEEQDLIVAHPVVSDPTDFKGLPFADQKKKIAQFLPFEELARITNATKPTAVFFDDLGQATNAVQAAVMQLLLARRIGEHKIPDCVTFIAATNGKAHRAGVTGILEPVKSRFVSIINVEPDLDAWKLWAYGAGVSPMVIGFVSFRMDLFSKFEPTSDMTNSPSPRTWHNVSRMLNAELPSEIELEMIQGSIGKGAAGEFVGFLRTYRDLPNIDGIILSPDKAKVPTEPSALWATVSALAQKAKPANIERIIKYANRLKASEHGEFAGFLLHDCEKRAPVVTATPAWTDMVLSDLGKLYQPAA
jgi:hypothetical protein